jgi:molybdenum cofactor synthesis domain-containing protein
MSSVVKEVKVVAAVGTRDGETRIEIRLMRAIPKPDLPEGGTPFRAVAGKSCLTVDRIDGSHLGGSAFYDLPEQGDRLVTGRKPRAISAAVVTISDRSSRGEREDLTWPALRATLWLEGYDIGPSSYRLVPDERGAIAAALRELIAEGTRLILTTGGTGVSPRDVTPEATREVIEKELPGFGEVMRMESLKKTPLAIGSRAVSGVTGMTLIINLPGSPKGALECFEIVKACAAHSLGLIAAEVKDCAAESEAAEKKAGTNGK